MASVIVTGASGLLGRAIYKEFLASDIGYKVVGLCHSRVRDDLIKCDLTDRSAVRELFKAHKPKVIIHAAAERKPDVVEKEADKTKKLNVSATEYLVEEIISAAGDGCYMIYISTDYVFDGKSPPYTEDSEPNPINKYGQSKLDGERIVLGSNNKHGTGHSVLRVPILYGDVEYLGESAVTILLNLLKSSTDSAGSREILVDHYQRRYPTHVRDVALVCTQLAQLYLHNFGKTAAETAGVFHWSSTEESMTKYDMVSDMAHVFSLPMAHIKPDPGPPKPDATPRPYDVKLDISRLRLLGFGAQTDFKEGLKSCRTQYSD